jgi:hypothetical protein
MTIRITDPEDVKIIKKYAASKGLKPAQAILRAIKDSDQLPFAQGEAATAKFMLRVMKEDWYSKKP